MYDQEETTICGRNLGADSRRGGGVGRGIFPWGACFQFYPNEGANNRWGLPRGGFLFFPKRTCSVDAPLKVRRQTKGICMLGKKQYDMVKHSLCPPANKLWCLRVLFVMYCVWFCLYVFFVVCVSVCVKMILCFVCEFLCDVVWLALFVCCACLFVCACCVYRVFVCCL